MHETFEWNPGNNTASHSAFESGSWTFTWKDGNSGRIERYKQVGTSDLCTLQVVQGKPVNQDGHWLEAETGDEAKLMASAPILGKPVTLPDYIKRVVYPDIIIDSRERARMGTRAASVLDNLIPSSVGNEISERNEERVAQLNAQDNRTRGPSPRNVWPAP
jgi:hypothetical protein